MFAFLDSLLSLSLHRNPTKHWPQTRLSGIKISSHDRSINGFVFGDLLEKASNVGRPCKFTRIGRGRSELLYAKDGFQLDFYRDRLSAAYFFLARDEYIPKSAQFSTPTLDSFGPLSSRMTLSVVQSRLGPPKSIDEDSDETIFFYRLNAINLDFEASPDGFLKRLNVYVDD